MQQQSYAKENIESLKKIREMHGLPEIKTATRHCLRCGNKFQSEDKKKQWMCDNCRKSDRTL